MTSVSDTPRRLNWRRVLTQAFWIASVAIWVVRLFRLTPVYGPFLYDWHVYIAGARDMVAAQLYSVPLTSSYPIPLESFNYPPGAAIVAIPFLPLPDTVGGVLWVIINIAAVAATAVLTARILAVKHVALWAGAAFCAYTIHPWAELALVGNNTPIVLLLIASFLWTHLNKRHDAAGALLGAAIATKLWPAVYLVVLAREGAWRTILLATGTAVVVTVVSLAWLGGPGVIGPMVAALLVRDEVAPDNIVLGISWLRDTFAWWPEWGGYAIAVVLLAIPARGLTGYGLATFAGMAAIPNLWRHYLASIVFGALLLWRGLTPSRNDAAQREVESSEPTPQAS